ncbi:hypothetical protein B484DRAFT_445792 [Ochromonadaceae sp. CCMP2298]|nr:hypothetical protein B484DRAFT_445792 [Ochromonadaceae sp. CCMP2298]
MAAQVSLADLNPLLTCKLCTGYYRDAYTILECMHTFCKSCILKHFHDHNVKGSISCPECKANLGIYGHPGISSKMMYDRDLQSIVDKIFPQFQAAEREEELRVYAEAGVSLRAVESVDRPAKKQRADENVAGEFQFPAALVPCSDCAENLRLPKMLKSEVKASLKVRVEKVKEFVLKRLQGVANVTADNIEVLFKGEVLQEGMRLSYRQAEFRDSILRNSVEFRYRLKTPLPTGSIASTGDVDLQTLHLATAPVSDVSAAPAAAVAVNAFPLVTEINL